MFLREVYPALEPLEQGANNSRTGSKGIQKIGVLSLQEDQRGEDWEVSSEEACRSCIQYDAWLKKFPDPQKVTL